MPELPEVETTRLGIQPYLVNQTIKKVIVRQARLRWPIPPTLPQDLLQAKIIDIQRRSKYLLLYCSKGCLIIHLGMSGRLYVLHQYQPANKHDHVDLVFTGGLTLRYTDPRRFGAILWTQDNPLAHSLLQHLGPEPLTRKFNSTYLYQACEKKQATIKQCIMDGKIVVGVGNIYANEALFLAGILPMRLASSLTQEETSQLVKMIKKVLKKAIALGGTTLKDFYRADGSPGYFANQLLVYGKSTQPCTHCSHPIEQVMLAQRSTYFCRHCQR